MHMHMHTHTHAHTQTHLPRWLPRCHMDHASPKTLQNNGNFSSPKSRCAPNIAKKKVESKVRKNTGILYTKRCGICMCVLDMYMCLLYAFVHIIAYQWVYLWMHVFLHICGVFCIYVPYLIQCTKLIHNDRNEQIQHHQIAKQCQHHEVNIQPSTHKKKNKKN